MKRCGLYLRVSTEDQAEKPEGSLTSQEQRLREYLKWRSSDGGASAISWVTQKVYRDEGWSGKNTNRPAFQLMRQDIQAGLLDVVVCAEMSRVSRSALDFLEFQRFLGGYKVEFVSLREQFDTTTPAGKMVMGVCALLAEFERDQISERTSANMQARARRGLSNGACPFGYEPNPDKNGHMRINEKAAAIVRLIFDLYLQLGSYKTVTSELNERGYRRPAWVSKKRGKHYPERKFVLTNVQYILGNKAYIGKKELHKENLSKDPAKLPENQRYSVVDAVWPAIVPEEKFHEVQRLMAQNHWTNHNVAQKLNHVFLLSGLLRCGHCGVILGGASGTGRLGKVYNYYRHYPASVRKPDCFLPRSINADTSEQQVIVEIGAIAEDDDLLKRVAGEASKQASEARPQVERQIAMGEEELLRLKGESDSLLGRMQELTRAQVEEYVMPRLEEISDKKRQLTNEVGKLKQALSEMPSLIDILDELRMSLKLFANVIGQLEPYKQKELLAGALAGCVLMSEGLELTLRYGAKKGTPAGLHVVTVPLELSRRKRTKLFQPIAL